MIKASVFQKVFLMSFLLISCSSDNPCDDRYVQADDGSCIPYYNPDREANLSNYAMYYHKTLGFITFLNGEWYQEGKEIHLGN